MKAMMRNFNFITEVQTDRIKLKLNKRYNLMNKERQVDQRRMMSIVETNTARFIQGKSAPF